MKSRWEGSETTSEVVSSGNVSEGKKTKHGICYNLPDQRQY